MVYYDRKKKRWLLGTAPINRKRKIVSPPKKVPVPEEAKKIPWIDLKPNECQYHLDGFWDEPSNAFPCCGLPVAGGRGRGRRFCEYHKEISEVGIISLDRDTIK